MILRKLRRWARTELGALAEYPPPFGVSAEVIALEVDILLGHSLGLDRVQILSRLDSESSPEGESSFRRLVSRRKRFEPVAYLLGKKEFFGREFKVRPGVLIPRPETELLVERALSYFYGGSESFFLLDIGTGCGAIALSILSELKQRFGESYLDNGIAAATDLSIEALRIAAENSRAFGFETRLGMIQGDLLAPIAQPRRAALTVLVCNPPYISGDEILPRDVEQYEPREALRAGEKGLETICRLIEQSKMLLSQGAVVLLEVGDNQAAEVESFARIRGVREVRIQEDLRGIKRVIELIG